jgi:5-oxoprolinase (ATP-hydrolysing)
METECASKLKKQGFDETEISHERILHLRYDRTDCVLIISRPSDKNDELNEFLNQFERNYKKEFGFTISDRPVVVVSFK